MKRYLVFAGENYYPGPGWCDFRDHFDTLEEAVTFAASIRGKWIDENDTCKGYNDWTQVVDTHELKIVESFPL